jgi:hypothetical protein
MKRLLGITLLLIALASLLQSKAQNPSSRGWQPAVYHGLTIGKSTMSEVRKALGKPYWVGREEETGTPMTLYLVTDPVPGSLGVFMSKGMLKLLRLNPKESLPRKEAIRIFGSDFRITRYSTDDCLPAGMNQMYENPDGEIEQIEYRERGIALGMNQGQIDVIEYVDGPFGPTHSRCPRSSKTKKNP